jgi:hypothetical protein
LDIVRGWMNVENDFANSPLYCNYMNSGLCGEPKALPGGRPSSGTRDIARKAVSVICGWPANTG